MTKAPRKQSRSKCEASECIKRPGFAALGQRAKRCGRHRLIGDVDVVSKRCEVEGCLKQPYYAEEGEKAKRCGKHRLTGDVNVRNKRCETVGCKKHPTFAADGQKAKRCEKHREDGDVNVVGKRCETAGCHKHPHFAAEGEKAKRCGKHREDGDVNVVNKRCETPGCSKIPNFAAKGEKPNRCKEHRQDGDVDVKNQRCETAGCLKQPGFAGEGEKAKRCGEHRKESDVDVRHVRCEALNCQTRPTFAAEGEAAVRCGEHREDGDVDVVSTRCKGVCCAAFLEKPQAPHRHPVTKIPICTHAARYLVREASDDEHRAKLMRYFGFKKDLVMRGEQAFYHELNKLVPTLRLHEKALDESVISALLKGEKDPKDSRPDYFFAYKGEDGAVFGLHVEYDEKNDHEDNQNRLDAIHALVGCEGRAYVIRVMARHGAAQNAVCKFRVYNKTSKYFDLTQHGLSVAGETAALIEERLGWMYAGLAPSDDRAYKVFVNV